MPFCVFRSTPEVRSAACAAACILSALLTACGGGGGAPTPSASQSVAAPTTAAAAAAAISGFAPSAGAVGTQITVSGAGLGSVTAARIGAVDAVFRVISDTAVELTVPAGAGTGRIELSAAGRVVLSATDFTVVAVPTVTTVTPTTVIPPARIALNGAALDSVRDVRLNALTLNVAARTPNRIDVDVPNGATSGTLTLVDTAGVERPVAQPITVTGPLAISSFSPATIVTGQIMTVNGANLDRAQSIVFANGATATIAGRSGTSRITAVVPDGAGSGVFRVRGNLNDEVISATALQVFQAIRVDANAVYRVAAAGASVTIAGTGLTEVSAVRIAATAATVTSQSATQLVFTVPSGIACGAIALDSASQPTVAAGSVVVGSGCAATLGGVEFAQVLSQGVTDARQRIVPGKEAWVRAYVIASQGGVPAPLVRLTGYNGAAILGTLTMAGPSTLPTASGAAVPDAVRYDEAQSFNVELPATWVRSGLSVRVEVDPMQQLGPPIVADAAPAVGLGTRIEIVLVPLVSGTYVPTMPTVAAVRDEITRRFPIPAANITVTTRQAYTLTSVTDGLDTSTEWSNALNELNQLRTTEAGSNNARFYFGFVRRSAGSIAGIGYVPGRAAIGWDNSGGWQRTMSHELGHNLSRPHAPCGSVASPDPNYPYAGGVLSATPLMDSVPVALDIISPVGQTDIMGYCNGNWFSDYNYREMQRYMEGQSSLIAAMVAADTAEQDLLLVSGTIGPDGLQLAPVQALRAVAMAGAGEYTLRLVARDGRVFEHAFDAELVDHADPPERHFAAAVPDPGTPLARVEVVHGGAPVPFRSSGLAAAQRATGPQIERLRSVDWSESNGTLRVQWDTAAAAHVAITYVANGKRTLLGRGRGGVLEFDVSQLPSGGRFEVGLSDGLNARTLHIRR
ncbi:MAG TPA: IPT/TIG domain-containing protein [Burkholderiaceae bacterium]|nr:IPT/TIG domain-containing protein [Burkholderiaceae bacterium]HQR69375.1 IPT/TIG domain-containing protein [Burkholderiaceae bacterium]